jgi:hypothetical protein
MIVRQASFCRYGEDEASHAQRAHRWPTLSASAAAGSDVTHVRGADAFGNKLRYGREERRRRRALGFRPAHCVPLNCSCNKCRRLYPPGIGHAKSAIEPASSTGRKKLGGQTKGNAGADLDQWSKDGPEKTLVLVYDAPTQSYKRRLEGEPCIISNAHTLAPFLRYNPCSLILDATMSFLSCSRCSCLLQFLSYTRSNGPLRMATVMLRGMSFSYSADNELLLRVDE